MMILQNVLFYYEDLFIICCRHVTLLESTVHNDCIIYVILLFTLQHNVTCFLLGMVVIIEKFH